MMKGIFLFIGTGEIVMIFLILMLFFGPNKIPELAREFGSIFRKFKNYTEDIKRDINSSVNSEENTTLKKDDNSIKRKK